MKYVSQQQFVAALRDLATFRGAVNRQSAQHVLPFLALRRKGVSVDEFTPYTEQDDFEFFDQHLRVGSPDYPYFDPIAGAMRIRTHPHSNVATARKGTFYRTWGAAEMAAADEQGGPDRWRLAPNYRDILRRKVLTKAARSIRIPAIPLAMILLRSEGVSDELQAPDLGAVFQRHFGLSEVDFGELFEDTTIPAGDFGDAPLADGEVLAAIQESGAAMGKLEGAPPLFQELMIGAEDAILTKVLKLFEDGYGGVIFVGPPGTGKSWYAVQVALALADGDAERIRKIQFHRSFQYEQFIEGFVPKADGTGFERRKQVMLEVIDRADKDRAAMYVVVIDEVSRSDPGRVFGELLTYMEPSRRDETFLLASGREVSVPPNIVFIGTMNSRDKSVSELDDAFDRRMAKIGFPPDERALEQFLTSKRVADQLVRRTVSFLRWVNGRYPLGHTFFFGVRNTEGLQRLWETQLKFVFEKQFKYEPDVVEEIRGKFVEITGVEL